MTAQFLHAWLRRFAIALVVVFSLTSMGIAYGYWFIEDAVGNMQRTPVDTEEAVADEPVNYLIIGSDSRDFVKTKSQAEKFGTTQSEGGKRSDTMLVAHLDPRTKTTLIVSFPRDLWVDIPGHGQRKLNAAFNYGPQSVIDTLKLNFNIPIHHYLEVNFTGFEGIVDAIGVVDLYFPAISRDTYTGLSIPYAGCHQFNGPRALQYVRSRHFEYKRSAGDRWREDPTQDIGRIARQQYFIRSLAATAINRGARNINTARKLITRGLNSVTASQSVRPTDLFALAKAFRNTDPEELESVTVPSSVDRIGKESVLILSEKDAAPIFARLRADAQTTTTTQPTTKMDPSEITVKVLNGSGVQGAAKAALSDFGNKGFQAGSSGNAPRSDYPVSQVIYAPGEADRATTVLAYMGGAGELVEDDAIIDSTITVVLGKDFVAVTTPGAKPKPPKSTSTTGRGSAGTPQTTQSPTKPDPTAVGCP